MPPLQRRRVGVRAGNIGRNIHFAPTIAEDNPTEEVGCLSGWSLVFPQDIKLVLCLISKYVHGLAPDSRDALVRALQGLPFPELKVIPEVLNTYAETLHKIVDISLVTTLNVLLKEESFYKEGEIEEALMKRLPDIEKLGLDFTTNKIKNLIEKQN